MSNHKAYEGLKVLDLTQGIAGPYATMLLAAHGADVLKLEPVEGDWGRVLGRSINRESVNYLANNWGKRSIALDLKSEAGLAVARRLADQCDIMLESFRPGVIDRLGLSYKAVSSTNPKIVYASISGFGQSGPQSRRPATDNLIQAYSGFMTMAKQDDGRPHRLLMPVVDVLTGLYANQAIGAAVLRQIRFGEGACLDINMVQAAAAYQSAKIMEWVETGGKSPPLYVPSGMYETADGFIVINGMRASHFASVCKALDCPDLAADPRWPTPNHRLDYLDEINAVLRVEFRKHPSEQILGRLAADGVMAERVRNYGEWLDEPHVQDTGACDWVETAAFGRLPVARVPGVQPTRWSPSEGLPPPMVGEHSRAVLQRLGYDDDWIAAQIAAGAIAETVRAA
ncbi:CoA transferase [Sphingomonas naphthae]|uniref:CoA transferase n=1 Tax=Sphingomonas naphthae TaxID=1813468 RepID=A0ABY7TG41_9SPHN|nr:CoA transferase [Sphingomonas naphthae]WCT72197.1 CoA transferase [Sphingomonas naphthae]